ncbi:MAG: hypothetical protein KatS3mg131_2421 [Candidatus Tectimicrobiota bacterium]|nr:MAG: hypothetical protein KatS3mg131_2421 [Candidatus Tectomicrobia bacterium]
MKKTSESCEYLKIKFSPTSLPIQQRWRNNGLSADFLADYLSTFFPGDDSDSIEHQAEIKSAISYIANELLENAMKFSYASPKYAISIDMYLEVDSISLYVTNSIASREAAAFQDFVRRLLSEDIDKLYMEQLTRHAEADSTADSGLGYITMLHDYNASLAWKFESLAKDAEGHDRYHHGLPVGMSLGGGHAVGITVRMGLWKSPMKSMSFATIRTLPR